MAEDIIGDLAGDRDRAPIGGRRGRGRWPLRGPGWSVATIFVLAVGFVAIGALTNFGEPSAQSTTAKTSRDPIPVAGQTWYAMGAPIGCKDKADLQRLTDLFQQKDPAFRKLYGEKSLAGLCKTLLDDAQVQVENSDDSGSPCVRPGGEPNCLFVIAAQLKSSSTLVDSQSPKSDKQSRQ
jgi:hypothetical protein